jgi:HD-like signal output (HDOD) protein
LTDLFRRAEALPPLPETAIRLVELIDNRDPSVHELENVLASDPSLAANIIRAASKSAYASYGSNVTTLTGAVLRLGLRNVRTLALTFAVHSLCRHGTRSTYFEPVRFARHSVFVGAMGEHLYVHAACADRPRGVWTPQEMFAAGLLHDLSKGLLANVAPEIYDAIWQRAHHERTTYDDAFINVFQEPLALLGCAAVVAWRLPDMFARSMAFIAEAPDEPEYAVCRECILYADALAPLADCAMETWEVQPPRSARALPPHRAEHRRSRLNRVDRGRALRSLRSRSLSN